MTAEQREADRKFVETLQALHKDDGHKVIITKTAFNRLIALALQNAK